MQMTQSQQQQQLLQLGHSVSGPPPPLHPSNAPSGGGGSVVVTNNAMPNSSVPPSGSTSISVGNNGIIERSNNNSLDRLTCAPPPMTNPTGSNPGHQMQGSSGSGGSHHPMMSIPASNQLPAPHHTSNVISANITNASGQGPGPGSLQLTLPNQDSNTSAGELQIPRNYYYFSCQLLVPGFTIEYHVICNSSV